MPEFRSLGVDSLGVEEYLAYDPETGQAVMKSVFKTAATNAVLEDNKREQTDNPKNQTKDKVFRKVASIPVLVHELWKSMYGVDPLAKGNEAFLERLLNDPDWRELRTDTGYVKLRK